MAKTRSRLALIAAVVALGLAVMQPAEAGDSNQFFASCKTSHVAQVDPIVSPGQTSAHQHEFFGNRTTNADSTYASMTAGTTTCAFSGDTAAYWVPTLISPSGQVIRAINVKVYYRGRAGKTVQAFPPDFRLIARVSHLESAGGSNFIVEFPSCWDGVHTDSLDHMSHMAYEVRKVCPSDHPVLLPRLSYVIRYPVKIAGNSLSSDIVAGAPPLSTMHADFWNTWQQDELEALVARCVNGPTNCGKITD